MSGTRIKRIQYISAMAAFGTIGVFVRAIPLTSSAIAFCRAVMATLLLLCVFSVRRKNPFSGVSARDLILLFLSGAAMGGNWIFLFEAYEYTSVSLATLGYYTAPIIVTVLSPVFFREKLFAMEIICFVGSTLGIALITVSSGIGGGSSDGLGIFLSLCAAALYATVIMLNKSIKTIGGLERTLIQFISASVALLPYVLLSGGIEFSALNGWSVGALLTVGLIHTGLFYCLYFGAIPHLGGQEAALLSYIDPLVAVFLSLAVLGENMTLLEIVGGAIILIFTLINEIYKKKRKPNA